MMPTPEQLKESWDLLNEGERPSGMKSNGHCFWNDLSINEQYSKTEASDRLLVAMGNVLLTNGWIHRGSYCWYACDSDFEDNIETHHGDRFSAALAALKIERGSDD